MGFGGLHPGARRFGGARSRVAIILDSLNRQRGSAYDTSPTSKVYAINMAKARAIAGAWSTNARARNQFDPRRCTDMLSRWEAIMGIVPLPSDTPVSRRARITEIERSRGEGNDNATVASLLARKLGPIFVGLTFTSAANAAVFWPAGTTLPDVTWYSTAAHILVHVEPLVGMTDGEFYAALAPLHPTLDRVLPSWTTWDWFVFSQTNHVKGFFLGDVHNLGWSALTDA